MSTLRRLSVVALLAASVAACGYDVEQRPKQTAGTVIGAGLGGLAGSQFGDDEAQLAATAFGTLLGAFLGSEIGKSLDRADQLAAAQATQTALEYNPTGTPSAWRNPDTGHYGTVTPTETYQSAERPCREYRHTVYIDGQAETLVGTACRQPDGTWRAV